MSKRKSKARKKHDEIDNMDDNVVTTRLTQQPSCLTGEIWYY